MADVRWRQSGSRIEIRRGSSVAGGDTLIAIAEGLYPTKRRITETVGRTDRALASRIAAAWDSMPSPRWGYDLGSGDMLPFAVTAEAVRHYEARVRRIAERWPAVSDPGDPLAPPVAATKGAELWYSAWVDTVKTAEVPGAAYQVRLQLAYHETPGFLDFVKTRSVWFGPTGEVLAVSGDGVTLLIFGG